MYGKDEVRMLRKLGHITYVGLNLHEFINYLKKLNIEE
jgi:phosphoribosylaminoimidazole carboxylase (NCAIR synthetase)